MKDKKNQRNIPVFILLFLASAVFLRASQQAVDDNDITIAIEAELLADAAVSSHLIDISTKEGIVTLSGRTDNILEKDRAVRIARMIKGVRAVVDKMEVKETDRPDEEIQNEVTEALLRDPAAESFKIDVLVNAGVVTLNGQVESYAERKLCSNIAKGVRGVLDVRNVINVVPSEVRPDEEIKSDIEHQLKADVRVDQRKIEVEVNDGEVKLSGLAGSAEEKFRAEMDAWVTGVTAMNSEELDIVWWAKDRMRQDPSFHPDPAWIRNAVQDALMHDPRVWSFDINVDVSGNVVTLSGVVDNLLSKLTAQKDAENTVGVRGVKNYIKVRPPYPIEDNVIARNVRDALERDPFVSRYDLVVYVENNKVHLYGTVDSRYEKLRAEDVAAGIHGVVDIRNYVRISEAVSEVEDWEIKLNLENKLFWDPLINRENIEIEVNKGIVTLRGKVYTWYAYNQAAKKAAESGADQVLNNLEVVMK